jgi:WD40 repeat protein
MPDFGGEVTLWDTATGQRRAVLAGHPARIIALAAAPTGARLATAAEDGSVVVWDALTGQELRRIKGVKKSVRLLALGPDGRTLAVVDHDLERVAKLEKLGGLGEPPDDGRGLAAWAIQLWDLAAPTGPRLLAGHTGGVTCLAFSPDGRTLVSGGEEGAVRFWNVAAGAECLTGRHGATVERVEFAPDGRTLLSEDERGEVKVWRWGRGE